MSKKVIGVWIVFIVIFALIGLFGWYYKDTLMTPSDEDNSYNPRGNENTKSCSARLNNINAVYKFEMGENDKINKTVIIYYNSNQNVDDYLAVEKLTKNTYAGLKATITGTSSDFQGNIVLTNELFVNDSTDDLTGIGLVLGKYATYASYSDLIVSLLPDFTVSCD